VNFCSPNAIHKCCQLLPKLSGHPRQKSCLFLHNFFCHKHLANFLCLKSFCKLTLIFAIILATLSGYESFTSFAKNLLFYNCYSYLSSRTFGRWHHCLGRLCTAIQGGWGPYQLPPGRLFRLTVATQCFFLVSRTRCCRVIMNPSVSCVFSGSVCILVPFCQVPVKISPLAMVFVPNP
jgi:hypothetical protein